MTGSTSSSPTDEKSFTTVLKPYLVAISEDERRAIRTTRNIAAHAGYRSMDDSLFWMAITRRVPEILDRIHAGG